MWPFFKCGGKADVYSELFEFPLPTRIYFITGYNYIDVTVSFGLRPILYLVDHTFYLLTYLLFSIEIKVFLIQNIQDLDEYISDFNVNCNGFNVLIYFSFHHCIYQQYISQNFHTTKHTHNWKKKHN